MPNHKRARKRRLVMDYRRVNARAKRSTYYRRRSTDVLAAAVGSMWYTFVDAVSGFNQIRNTKRAREVLAIVARSGKYLPVGLTLGPVKGPDDFNFVVDLRTGRVVDGKFYTDAAADRAVREEYARPHVYLLRNVRVGDLQVPTHCKAEAMAFGMISSGQANWNQLRRLIDYLPTDAKVRWPQEGPGPQTDANTCACGFQTVHGRGMELCNMAGVVNNTVTYPWVTRALAGILGTWSEELQFTSCTLFVIEYTSGIAQGFQKSGQLRQFGSSVFGVSGWATAFSPKKLHATLPWVLRYMVGLGLIEEWLCIVACSLDVAVSPRKQWLVGD
ncbi:POL [Symbiodinium microadriaticum]|nr:POL [Symbiodinium microadriaticum]